MESRKRFRPLIDDKHVKEMFSKKRIKCEPSRKKDSAPETIRIEALPSEMIPSTKKYTKVRTREIQKPENWIKPVEERRSRDDNLTSERNNIDKEIRMTIGWSRSCQLLDLARKPNKTNLKQVCVDEL